MTLLLWREFPILRSSALRGFLRKLQLDLVLSSVESISQGDYSGAYGSSNNRSSSAQEDIPPSSPDEGGLDTGGDTGSGDQL